MVVIEESSLLLGFFCDCCGHLWLVLPFDPLRLVRPINFVVLSVMVLWLAMAARIPVLILVAGVCKAVLPIGMTSREVMIH